MKRKAKMRRHQQLRRDLELENFSLRMRLHYLNKEQGPQVATLKRTVERVRGENSKLDAEIHLAWEELTHLQRQDVITSQQKEDHDRLHEIKPEFISGGGTEEQNDWRRQPLQFSTHNLKETDDTLWLKESDGDEELEKLSDGSEEELGSFSVSENPIGTNLAEEKFLPQVSMEEYDLSTVQTSQECRNLFIDGDHITAAVHDLLKERESLYAELAQVSECNGNLYVPLDRAKEHCERWRQAFWRLQEEHVSIISYVESLGSSTYPSHHLSSTHCQVWVDKLDGFESCAQELALQAQVKDVDELKARVSRHNLIGFDEPQGNLCLQASEVQGKLSNTYRKCPHADIKGICGQDVATQTASATQRPFNVNTTNRKLQMSFNSDVSCSTSSLVTRSQSLENRKQTPPHRKHVVELHDEDMTSSDGEGVPRSSVRHVCQGCVYEVNITQLPAKEKMFFGRTGSSSFKPRQGKTRVIIESEETFRQDDSNMSGASEEFLKTYQDLRTARRDLYRLQKENVKMRNRLQEQKKLLEEMMLRLAENNRLKKGLLKTVSPQSSNSPQLLPDLKP